MFDDLSFDSTGFERLGERSFGPRPAAMAISGGRSAADLEREANEHFAKAESLRREAQECKDWSHFYKWGVIGAGLTGDGPLAAALGIAEEGEKYESDRHTREASEEQKLADQIKQRAELARREEETQKAEQERQRREAESLDRQFRDAIDRQRDIHDYQDIPDRPGSDDGRMWA
jgi:hypothetical protein